ncbi:MAG: hypothetical protein AAFV80_10435 [Bacteroidota bacterium]
MVNWKTIVGLVLIFASVSEFVRVWSDYQAGHYESWPFGVEVGAALFCIGGFYLIRSGMKAKKL